MRGVSLFSGAGGMDLGFINAGINVIWANEIDKDAIETYKNNIGSHIVEKDIKTINSKDIPECDIVFGGPPCQGFSVAGKMNPDDPRSSLIWEFYRVVKDKSPKIFVMENVANLVSEKFKPIAIKLIQAFEEIGYRVSYKILNAKDYSVPQSRERVFFIGMKDGEYSFPTPSKEITVRQAISNIISNNICNAKIVPAKNPILRKSPYAGMLFNGQGRPLNLDKPSITLTASMGGNKTPIIDDSFLNGMTKFNWVEGYHAFLMRGNKPQKEAPKFLRRLSVEEAQALQSFSSRYKFSGSQSSQYRQIGNAVPPKLAKAIALSLIFRN